MSRAMLKIWSDIDNKFELNMVGDLNVVTNLNCLEQAVLNRLLTSKGERVMRPIFGSRLEALLFEPISSEVARKIAQEIVMCLREENRIIVSGVEIIPVHSQSFYEVTISGMVKDLGTDFDFTRVLVHQL